MLRRQTGQATAVGIGLAIAAFGVGLTLPWLAPGAAHEGERVQAPPSASAVERRPAAPSRAPTGRDGILAIGDDRIHAAAPCLARRAVRVHPRVVRDVEELFEVMEMSARTRAAVIVHLESDAHLVDGHIHHLRSLLGPATRIVWATIRLDDLPWDAFSYQDRVNASIRNVVRADPQGRVLDWQRATTRHPEWDSTWSGLTTQGCKEYARHAVRLARTSPPR